MGARERLVAFLLVSVWLVCCLTLLRAPQLLAQHAASSSQQVVSAGPPRHVLSLRGRDEDGDANPQVVMAREDSETLISTVAEGGTIDVDVGKWTNQHNIVHVIHTRFLQNGQFQYENLAKASYDMLRTFTLPSIRQQTNRQEFLWIIWADPNFRGPIAKQLMKDLKEIPNALLLGLNDGDYQDEMLDQKVERDFRSLNGMSIYNLPDILLAGQRNVLLDYYTASQRRLLIETRLDVGDALSRNFVESVQSHAAATVSRNNNPKRLEIFCPEDHLEWRYYQPGAGPDRALRQSHRGHLVQYHNNDYCLHSGRSVVYNSQATARQLQRALAASEDGVSRRTVEDKADGSILASDMEVLEECPEREVKPQNEICEQRGTLVKKHETQDLHMSGSCPTGSFFCKDALKSVFGGPRFGTPQQFVECQVEGTTQFVSVSVKVSHTSRDRKEQTGVQMTIDAKSAYLISAVYVKGGPGGHLYQWDWPENGGVGGTRSGTFQTPNEHPIGHIDLCVIPTKNLCEGDMHLGGIAGANATIMRRARKEDPRDECRRKLRMVYDEEQEDYPNDINYIRNAVLLSQSPMESSIKETIPEEYRDSPRHMLVQKEAFGAVKTAQATAWRVLEHDFGVQEELVIGLHRRMDENLVGVLEDAIETPCFGLATGCHEGHTKRKLERLLVKARKRREMGLKASKQDGNDLRRYLDKKHYV